MDESVEWLSTEPLMILTGGYRILKVPDPEQDMLAKACWNLRTKIAEELASTRVVPVLASDQQVPVCLPSEVKLLPEQLAENFRGCSQWRPELLFGKSILDEVALGRNGLKFARWLDWGQELRLEDVSWRSVLPSWWEALPTEQQISALFALWDGMRDQGLDHAPVVPTEAGNWVSANELCWLNEEPPNHTEPCGADLAAAIAPYLPSAEQTVPQELKRQLNKTTGSRRHDLDVTGRAIGWFMSQVQKIRLADVVHRASRNATDEDPLFLEAIREPLLSRKAVF